MFVIVIPVAVVAQNRRKIIVACCLSKIVLHQSLNTVSTQSSWKTILIEHLNREEKLQKSPYYFFEIQIMQVCLIYVHFYVQIGKLS